MSVTRRVKAFSTVVCSVCVFAGSRPALRHVSSTPPSHSCRGVSAPRRVVVAVGRSLQVAARHAASTCTAPRLAELSEEMCEALLILIMAQLRLTPQLVTEFRRAGHSAVNRCVVWQDLRA